MIEHGHATHAGLHRRHNEDTYWADTEHGLWVVADGMGGPGRGEAASASALDTMVSAIASGAALADAIHRTADALDRLCHDGAAVPMASTLAALMITPEGNWEAGWVGDSPVFTFANGALSRLVRPEAPPGQGHDAVRSVGTRHPATQALGLTPTADVEVQPVAGTCEPGMQFLLCSDGLTDELGEPRIAALLARTDLAAQECVDQLVLAALDAGGHDNITALVVRVS